MTTYTDCSGCQGTLGQNGCPKHRESANKSLSVTQYTPAQQGWVCPRCGTVNAPWMPTCCKNPPLRLDFALQPEVTHE